MFQFKPIPLVVCYFIVSISCQDYTITPITTSSGLYYEKVGEVLLSNSNWQFVTSVDYEGYLLFYEYLIRQANEIKTFCEALNSSVCDERYIAIKSNVERIEATDESMANFLGVTTKARRVKRFWGAIGRFFKKVGGIVVRTIFGGGGSSQVDLSGYDRAIGGLQAGQRELENQINLQRTMFMVQSERQNFNIERLTQNQGEIKTKLSSLQDTFEKDSAKKEQEIKELRTMLSEVDNKLKMQEEAQKKLSGKVDIIEKNLEEVDKNIKLIREKISNNTKAINKLEVISTLNSMSINFNLLMYQFETEQKTLYEVIKNANKGEIDPYILTPLDLIEMLRDLQAHLPEGTKFPYFPSIENARKLYNVIKPSVYLFKYKIMFILRIPLVYSKTYNMQKVTSLPIAVGGKKFIFILPQEPFLIIDNSYLDYMPMDVDNFKQFCTLLEPTKYICKQFQQILHSYDGNDCAVSLYKSSREIPDSCNKRIMSLDKPTFLQLQQPRTWIYLFPESDNIIINCNVNRTTLPLEGSGFLHVNEDCLVRTNNFELQYLVEFTKPVQSNFSPPLNLKNFIDLSNFDYLEMKGTKGIQIIFPFDFNKLEQISHSTEVIKTNLNPLYYTLLAVGIVLVAVFIYLVYKKRIDLSKLRNLIPSSNASSQVPPSTPVRNNLHLENHAASAPVRNSLNPAERLKMKFKVSNPDDIQDVSIYGNSSLTDPESEYLTVKFKVKKDPNEPSDKRRSNTRKLDPPLNDLAPKVTKEKRYLEELRKLKPSVE